MATGSYAYIPKDFAALCDFGFLGVAAGICVYIVAGFYLGNRWASGLSLCWMGILMLVVRPRWKIENVPKIVSPHVSKLLPKYMRTPEWKLTVNTVLSLLEGLDKQNSNKHNLPTSLGLIWAYSSAKHNSELDDVAKAAHKTKLPKNTHRYLLFANCAYGSVMLAALGVIPPPSVSEMLLPPESRDSLLITKRTGVPAEHIVRMYDTKNKSSLICPRYFVCVDQETKSLVLSIRGTASIQDAVVSLCAKTVYDRTLGAYAHSGILSSAYSILKAVSPTIANTLSLHPKLRKIVITGHSLGGGVSLIISHLLSLSRTKPIKGVIRLERDILIETYAFAPPPVMSKVSKTTTHNQNQVNLTMKLRSFVHAQDIVPRLSLESVERMIDRISTINKLNLSLIERIQGITDPKGKGVCVMEKVERIMEERGTGRGSGHTSTSSSGSALEYSSRITSDTRISQLEIPGEIFCIKCAERKGGGLLRTIWNSLCSRNKKSVRKCEKYGTGVRLSRPDDMGDLLILPQGISQHMPKQYEEAVGYATDVRMRRSLRRSQRHSSYGLCSMNVRQPSSRCNTSSRRAASYTASGCTRSAGVSRRLLSSLTTTTSNSEDDDHL